jgi:hypothetical protein
MAFEGLRAWWHNRPAIQERREGLQKIRADLDGIERWVGVWLFRLKSLILTELIQVVWNWKADPEWQERLPVMYVGVVTAVLGFFLWWSSSLGAGVAFYFLASIIVYLLNVVLLDHKVFSDPRSPERSLILFIINVAQVVLIFAIFYRWEVPSLGPLDAFIDAVLVFGTVSLPKEIEDGARLIAAGQVATDFILLAVFLAHFVGRVGRGKTWPRAEDLFALGSPRSLDSPAGATTTMKNWAGGALALSVFVVPIVAAAIIGNVTDTKDNRGVYVLLVGIPWAFFVIKTIARSGRGWRRSRSS